jgi:class 3 adenylate cyclase/tetratricopeptide (TPR) repeat protein
MPVNEARKLVSVLFADIGHSLALIRGRDPESARDLLAPAVERMAQAVRDHGGTVAQHLGDGILALFGAPAAQEDHATAACLAGLAIRDAVADRAGLAPSIKVRVGIHSGEVLIVTPPPGSGVVLQATGEVVHVAARLERSAAPGTVQASLATLKLARPVVEARALPSRRVRGLAAPLATVEILGAAEPRAQPPPRTRLVGRQEEIEACRQAVARALRDEAVCLHIGGEPGTGKSRLAAAIVGFASELDLAVVRTACQPYAAPPLGPLRAILGHLPPADQPPADPAALAALVDPAASDAAWRAEEPAVRRARILDAGAWRLRTAADARPLLLLVEDAHWLEPETAHAIARLAALPRRPGLMVVLTSRTAAPSPPIDPAGWQVLQLGPLRPDQAIQLAAELLREMTDRLEPRIAERLVGQLAARSEGNPFFAEQIAASWREAGPGEGGAALPGRLRTLLAARVDRLAAAEKHVLEVAAVIGNDCAPALLSDAAGIAQDRFGSVVEHLVRGGLVQRTADGQLTISHALLRDAVDAGLTRASRRSLHRACLDATLRQADGAEADQAPALLRHAIGADLPDAIIRHGQAAARQAMAAYANEKAAEHLGAALRAATHLGDAPDARRQQVELMLALREPLFRIGDIARIGVVLRNAARVAASLDDPALVGRVAILSSHAHWLAGDPTAAETEASRASALGDQLADEPLAVRARFQLGLARLATGELRQAAELMAGVAQIVMDGAIPHGRYGLDHSLAATAAGYQARALVDCGDVESAARAAGRSAAAAERDGRPFAQIFASLAATAVAIAEGDLAQALARSGAAVDWCHAADARLMQPVALTLLGQAQLAADQADAARRTLSEAVAAADAMGFRIHQGWRMALLGEAELRCGNPSAAAVLAARADALAGRCREKASRIAARRVAALAAAALGDASAAAAALVAAGRSARRLGLEPMWRRCGTDAAEVMTRSAPIDATRRAAG